MLFIRFISRLLARVLFRLRIYGGGVLDTPGPVLLIPNHVSWFDWWLLGLCVGEDGALSPLPRGRKATGCFGS